ncbi:MAG: dual specificity protein phosphatase family protein [Aigarchaeota archaeon]|nr:dual specificity protein phosphatase family protein [Candidatus Pelearchaeum maunauluense]
MDISSKIRRIQGLFVEKPVNFSWVNDRIAASGLPAGIKHLTWLKKQGITAILTLTEKSLNLEDIRRLDFEYRHIPMQDLKPPTVEKLVEASTFIRLITSRGGRVLVHCAAGLGRTGTVLAAYFMLENNLNPEDAIRYVRRIRPGSIEAGQEKALWELDKLRRAGS